jgi:hypothetical protein
VIMSDPQHNSLAFNLGAFFGHIVQAVKTDVTKQPDAATQIVRKQVGEARLETQEGPVTLRRTIIDEVRTEDAPRD